MEVSARQLFMGFLAGAIAVVTAHEAINYVLLQQGLFPRVPWSMEPAAVTGVPQIVSAMFWGGVWGSVFALAMGHRNSLLNGVLFGVLGPALLGVFIAVPLLTGRFPMFFGGDAKMIGSVMLILAGWGAATAWLYGKLASR
ncbi:MAG: hypothetical protein ABL894_11320 [Hyphomicrobium sp.]